MNTLCFKAKLSYKYNLIYLLSFGIDIVKNAFIRNKITMKFLLPICVITIEFLKKSTIFRTVYYKNYFLLLLY